MFNSKVELNKSTKEVPKIIKELKEKYGDSFFKCLEQIPKPRKVHRNSK